MPQRIIELDTVVQRDSDQEFSTIDDEVIMLSLKEGQYYGLNSIASRIWSLIDKPIKIIDLINLLLTEYDVSKEECQKDTIECILDFEQKSLLIRQIDA